MRCFALDEQGDVVVRNQQIMMIQDKELICQKIRQVFLTNQGEWWLDQMEGIRRADMLTKNPNYDLLRDQIKLAVFQVDDRLCVDEIKFTKNSGRKLLVEVIIVGERLKMEV